MSFNKWGKYELEDMLENKLRTHIYSLMAEMGIDREAYLYVDVMDHEPDNLILRLVIELWENL